MDEGMKLKQKLVVLVELVDLCSDVLEVVGNPCPETWETCSTALVLAFPDDEFHGWVQD